jgi:hypothetical protein
MGPSSSSSSPPGSGSRSAGRFAIRPVLLDRAWGGVRRLPLLAKPIVWIAFLPWLSGLAIWESGWRTPRARLIAVVIVALAFIAFWWAGTPAGRTSS